MVMQYLLFLSSILAVSGTAAIAYGYRASLFSGDPATRWFSRSMALLALSIFGRRFTWDILVPATVGGYDPRPLNIVYNLIAILAVYAGLNARLWLIPEDERGQWHWYSAWLHPSTTRIRDR